MCKGWQLITSSAEKAINNPIIRGVGLLLSPNAYKSLLNIESISPHIIIAIFRYSPTNSDDEENAKQFYNELSNLIQ